MLLREKYKRFDEELFKQDVAKQPWHTIEGMTFIDSAWTRWKSLFLEVCDRHAPYKSMTVRGIRTPWVTDEIITMTQERDHVKRKAEKSQSPVLWHKYRTLRNQVNNLREALKSDHYQSQIHENQNNSRKLWNVMNDLMGKNVKSEQKVNKIVENGSINENDKDIANAFNTFFTNIGKTLANKIPLVPHMFNDTCTDADNVTKFSFISISEDFVYNNLNKLCVAKATGSDRISARLLRCAAAQIARSITCILNKSLRNGQVPLEWKHARVIPLHKEGPTDDTNNYRPISVLPILSKLLERGVHDQLYRHLDKTKSLNKWQSGFRPGYSTATALTYVTDLLFKEIDSKNLTGVLFLDLKKAFDTVDHGTLLSKLETYGITENEQSWFKSYLSDRSQSVSIGNTSSDSMGISHGVPQGSILGPLLFTLYINDLPGVTSKCKVILYADDTALIYSHKSKDAIQDVLSTELCKVKNWLDLNKLTLNAKKTKSMLFGSQQLLAKSGTLDIKICGENVEQVKVFKYLGNI